MKKEVTVGVVSSLITAVITYLIVSAFSAVSDETLKMLTNRIIIDERFPSLFKEKINDEISVYIDSLNYLNQKLTTLESKLTSNGESHEILGVVRIESMKIISSTPGISYDSDKGLITFKNPDRLDYVPLVSHSQQIDYSTRDTYVRDIVSNNKFTIRSTARDTGANGYSPQSCTIVIIGLK